MLSTPASETETATNLPSKTRKRKFEELHLSGKFGSGKSLAAEIISDIHKEHEGPDAPVQFHAFADQLKKTAAGLTGETFGPQWNDQAFKNQIAPAFGISYGAILQRLGMCVRKEFGDDVWMRVVLNAIDNDPNPETLHINQDTRLPNEGQAAYERKAKIFRLEGDPSGAHARSNRDKTHISETGLDDFKHFDEVIDNREFNKEALRQKLLAAYRRHFCQAVRDKCPVCDKSEPETPGKSIEV